MNTMRHRAHSTTSHGSRRERTLRSVPPHSGQRRVLAREDWLAADIDEMFEEPQFYRVKRSPAFPAAHDGFPCLLLRSRAGGRLTAVHSLSLRFSEVFRSPLQLGS